ncbi:LCP family protein [Streptomyces tardus]|uniref:LCP family protein n=1 Tax=Streptomyces tardus TaxID=2780544 RepID=UPI0027E509F8|nr:LCP family protein [Streptomyces tardus]
MRRRTTESDDDKGIRQAGARTEDGAGDRLPGNGKTKDTNHTVPLRQAEAGAGGGAGGAGGGGAGGGGEGGEPGAEPPRKKRRALKWTAIGLAVLVLGTGGAGFLYYQHLNGNLTKDALHLGDKKLEKNKPNAEGQTPMNILLLGSDSRNSKENVRLGGSHADAGRPPLADVQMLVHVSADRSNMSVLSIPRDTRVTIPRCTDTDDGKVYEQRADRINTSLQNGGPGCTVATWEELTGISIDHFMMVDFSGVVSMADAVGGVPVCVDANVNDPKSGLKLKKGESVVRGEQALQWLRTRHGFEDGSDIGRAKAQQMYMNSMVRELKAGTKLTNPGKLRKLAEEGTKALTVDDSLDTVMKLYDLGEDLRRVPTKRITMATMPWTYSQGGSYVLPKEADAERVFGMIRADIALDGKDKGKKAPAEPEPADTAAPPGEISVRVMNGTGTSTQTPVTGRANAISSQLQGKGFARAYPDQAPTSKWDTQLSYADPELEGDAQAVAKALGVPEKAVKRSSEGEGITLVVGADWRTGGSYPAPAGGGSSDEKPEDDGKAPDSLDGMNGDDDTACMNVSRQHTW